MERLPRVPARAPYFGRVPLSANENVAVGIAGGCSETALLMPVLTWKFCRQEGRPYPPFPGMYRGVGVQAASVAPLTAMQMVANGVYERLITGGSRKPTDSEVIACALGAGATSALVYGPVDMTMIHQQKLGLGPVATVSHLMRNHGVASLWRGVVPTAGREAIYTAGYLALAPVFTKRLMRQEGWEESFFASAVLGSMAAGVLANVTSHPVDTVKTVLQADVTGARYTGMLQASAEIYREAGIGGFFLGGLARTIRVCGAFFVVSTIREKCIQYKSASAQE